MEPKNIVYDICRHYVADHKESVLAGVVSGYCRGRHLAKLATCSSLFDPALHGVEDFRFLRQIEAFFKKNALFAVSAETYEQAKLTFVSAEQACSETNVRLKNYVCNPERIINPELRAQVLSMGRYISSVLGDYEVFLGALPRLMRVTPGATAHSARKWSFPQQKFLALMNGPWIIRRAAKYAFALSRYFGSEDGWTPRFTVSNRVEIVPKNYKTDRTIACEPEGNLPLQLAFDAYAKRRLRRVGIDLSCQSANVELAKSASINDDFVTVDFAAASDTISFNTVSMLFPVDWLSYLIDVRSPCYRGKFGCGVYSKFSSMGNGATFAIETLIFAAACHACGSRNFLVYGDDVIIEKEFYEKYITLTRFLGFTINEEKSFSEGPFRESCGGDFFNGIDVTPVYVRRLTDRPKAALCHLINTLRGICLHGGALEAYLAKLENAWKLPRVPYDGNSMSGIWINPTQARTEKLFRYRKCKSWSPEYKAFLPVMEKAKFYGIGGYLLWFVRRTNQVRFASPWEHNAADDPFLERKLRLRETSWAPVFEHAYVRRWVYWKPVDGMPAHLYY
jgi:hypothetical protein